MVNLGEHAKKAKAKRKKIHVNINRLPIKYHNYNRSMESSQHHNGRLKCIRLLEGSSFHSGKKA